jgi:hypothetical protein
MKSCANGLLIVGVGQATGHNITSVAFDGVALAPVPAGFSVSPVGNAASLWYLANPPAGTHSISMVLSGNWNGSGLGTDWGAAEALSFCGVDPVHPISVVQASAGNSANPTNTIAPIADTSYIVEILDITYNASSYFIPGLGWAPAKHPQAARAAMTYRGPVTSAVATSDIWKVDGAYPYADVMVALNPIASDAGAAIPH